MILFLPSYYFCFPTFFSQVKFNTKKLTLSSSLPKISLFFFPLFFLTTLSPLYQALRATRFIQTLHKQRSEQHSQSFMQQTA